MAQLKANLSKKDSQFRDFALTGNMWKVIWRVGFPLAVYNALNQAFKVLDTMMASHISSQAVSAVAYLSQLNLMLSAVGGGLAVGASLKVSQAYGEGNYKLVKQRVSSLFALCTILSLAVIFGIIPFTDQFLRLANTPEELIVEGKTYFVISLIAMVITFFNNVYISIERARGNSARILRLNMGVIAIKLLLTAFFVYILNGTIVMIAWATVASQVFLLLAAVINMRGKDNAFGFSIRAVSLRGDVTKPMISQSVPVIVEKIAFSFGKVVVNSMSTGYGVLTVGALGISNNLGGFTTMPQNGFQEGGAAIISQNLGAGHFKRALDAFKTVVVFDLSIGVLGFVLSTVFMEPISGLFAGEDRAFQEMICRIYRYEAFGTIPLGLNSAVLGLLYGMGKTKHTLFINFCRVFMFRIPVLWFLQNFTSLGQESVGVVMMVSNVLTGLLALVIAVFVIRQEKRNRMEGTKEEAAA